MIAVDIRKQLGPFALDVAFAADHETVVLFGHSGSGKSVTLAAIAGLLRPDSGSIEIGGRTVFDAARRIDLPPQRRSVGYVVQHLALFPHLTAAENIAYSLVAATKDDRRRRVAELMALLNLGGLEDRLPRQLSGGQQQRVALARALARPVDVLLLDEPFSALDETLRADLRSELLRLRAELAVPIVFVTHDLREAHLLADRIAVLDDGRVLQFAPRDDVFRRPRSRRVAELTGVRNIFPATVLGREESGFRLDAAGLSLLCEAAAVRISPGDTVDVAIRAERVIVHRRDPEALPGVPNLLVVEVVDELAYGSGHIVRFRPVDNGPMLEVELSARPYEVLGLGRRGRWTLELPPADLHVMPREAPT